MCKKIGVAAIAVVLGFVVMRNTKLGDWAHYAFHSAKSKISSSVPPEVQIDKLRYDLTQLEPEIEKNIEALAKDRVACRQLTEEVQKGRVALARRMSDFKAAKKDLDSEMKKISFNGKQLNPNDAKTAIASEWETYKTAEKALESKEKLLKAKQEQVDKTEMQVVQWKNLRDQLKSEIDAVDAELKTLKLAEAENKLTDFDNSRLSRFQDELKDLKKVIDERAEKVKIHAELNGGSTTQPAKADSADAALKEIGDRDGSGVANK